MIIRRYKRLTPHASSILEKLENPNPVRIIVILITSIL
jgi:hypothetical protein